MVTDEVMKLFHRYVPGAISCRLLTRNGLTQLMPEDELAALAEKLEGAHE